MVDRKIQKKILAFFKGNIRDQRPLMGVKMSQRDSSDPLDPLSIPDTEREASEAAIKPSKIRKPRTKRPCPMIPTEQSLLRVPTLKITKKMLKGAGPKPNQPEFVNKVKKARAALYHDYENEKVTVARKCCSE